MNEILDYQVHSDKPKQDQIYFAGKTNRFKSFFIDNIFYFLTWYAAVLSDLMDEFYYVCIGFFLLGILSKIVLEYKFGASVGKMLMKIQIVNSSAEIPSFKQILIRSSFKIIFCLIVALLMFLVVSSENEQEMYRIIGQVAPFSILIFLALFVTSIVGLFNRKQQGLHDMLAKTYVIKKPNKPS